MGLSGYVATAFFFFFSIYIPSVEASDSTILNKNNLTLTKVSALGRGEPALDATIAHGGLIWSANSNPSPELEVFDPRNGKKIDAIALPHNVLSLQPWGLRGVLAVGRTQFPDTLTHYSIVKFRDDKLRAPVTRTFFPEMQAEGFAGDWKTNRRYFSNAGSRGIFVADTNFDTALSFSYIPPHQIPRKAVPFVPGPNGEDLFEKISDIQLLPENPFAPTRPVIAPSDPNLDLDANDGEAVTTSANFLGPAISGPGQMILIGESLFVLEWKASDPHTQNLVKIDLKTEKAERTFNGLLRSGILRMVQVPSTPYLAIVERDENQLLFVNYETNRFDESKTVAIPGRPRDVTVFGKCLAVLAPDGNTISFVDYKMSSPQIVLTWDLNGLIDKWRRPSGIAIDRLTGNVFVRSVDPFSQSEHWFDEVVLISEKDSTTKTVCSN
jgi:hypothetical protein